MGEILTAKYWDQPGVHAKVIDYVGDGAANRLIELGGRFDYVEVHEVGAWGAGSHCIKAESWSDSDRMWTGMVTNNWTNAAGSNASCITRWYGFRNNQTRIQTGTNGALAEGTNAAGKSYRLTAYRYRQIP